MTGPERSSCQRSPIRLRQDKGYRYVTEFMFCGKGDVSFLTSWLTAKEQTHTAFTTIALTKDTAVSNEIIK